MTLDTDVPRAGWAFAINSALVTGACLLVGGFALSGFAHWDPCVWISAVILVGPSFAIAHWQYRATFTADLPATRKLLIALIVVDGIALLAACGAILEPLAEGIVPTQDYLINLVAPMAVFATWAVATTFAVVLWDRRLTRSVILAEVVDPMLPQAATFANRLPQCVTRRFSLREIFSATAALAIVMAGMRAGVLDILPQSVSHGTPGEARLRLPAGASDVNISRGSRGAITYDFAIDEAGFWEWSKKLGGSLESDRERIQVQPIGTPVEIMDCAWLSNQSVDVHRASRGWHYSWRKEDRAILFLYDADTKRAYYHAHFH